MDVPNVQLPADFLQKHRRRSPALRCAQGCLQGGLADGITASGVAYQGAVAADDILLSAVLDVEDVTARTRKGEDAAGVNPAGQQAEAAFSQIDPLAAFRVGGQGVQIKRPILRHAGAQDALQPWDGAPGKEPVEAVLNMADYLPVSGEARIDAPCRGVSNQGPLFIEQDSGQLATAAVQ